MVLLDAEKNTLAEFKMINLQDDAGSDSTSLLTIAKSLQPGAYGIDLADVGL
jgi:hypothetical protein